MKQIQQALRKQRRYEQKSRATEHLQANQHTLKTVASPATSRTTASLLQGCLRIRRQKPEGWDETRQKARHTDRCEGEQKNSGAGMDFGQTWNINRRVAPEHIHGTI